MDSLPVELILYIFDYIPHDIISISQVCRYFNLIATTKVRNIKISLQREKEEQMEEIITQLKSFKAIQSIEAKLVSDLNVIKKAAFCAIFSNKISKLCLSEFTYLNPLFLKGTVTLENLETLSIEASDLTSASNNLPYFIIKICKNLKNLKISGCSGLEIDSLNLIGRKLNRTKISKLELHPIYSYFDMSSQQNRDDSWTIENLTTLSVRSKLVVMKKNFVRNMLGNSNKKYENLKQLDLVADVNFGTNLVSYLTQHFPNLEHLTIGKGIMDIRNQDFLIVCNHYKFLKSLEFHFIIQDEPLDLKNLKKNLNVTKLTIGLTKTISMENLREISECLPNITQLCVILFYLIPSNKDFIDQLVKIFSKTVKELRFTHMGMVEMINVVL